MRRADSHTVFCRDNCRDFPSSYHRCRLAITDDGSVRRQNVEISLAAISQRIRCPSHSFDHGSRSCSPGTVQ